MHSINYGQARRQLGAANADRLWRSLPSASTRAELTPHEHATLRAARDNPDTVVARFNRNCVVRRARGLGPDYGELYRPTTP